MPTRKPTRSVRYPRRRTPNAAGRRKRAVILRSAERILLKLGYRGLTLRAVASGCGISTGNLHYHFPTIQALAVALVDSALRRYRAEFEQQLSELSPRSSGKFIDLMGWLVLDAAKPEANALFREFWSMESRYPEVAAAMASFYSELTGMFAERLRSVFPHVPKQRLLKIGRLMGLLSEGSGIIGASDRIAQRVPTEELVRIARETIRMQLSRLELNED